jgi:hypothetical protein
MNTIKVLIDTLPGGYTPILEAYNARRPAGSEPIRKAQVCEGGFEIPLNDEELKQKKKYREDRGRSHLLDANDCVRQLRWSNGRLDSGYHVGFHDEETQLLYEALVSVLGAGNVIMTE